MSMLAQACQQDDDAWLRLVSLYLPFVLHWGRKSGLSRHDAENVSQIVFTKVFRQLHTFKKETPDQKFRKWIKTIFNRSVIDFFRSVQRRDLAQGGDNALVEMQIDQVESLDDEDDQLNEEASLCRRAMEIIAQRHSNTYVRVFEEYVLNDHSPAYVAELLSISIETVYKAKFMVLKSLKKEFSDLL